MALIITELSIQSPGVFAIEMVNTGATPLDVTNYRLQMSETPAGSSVGMDFSSVGVPTTLAPGEVVVIGHSSLTGFVSGTYYSNASLDVFFEGLDNLSLVHLRDRVADTDLDHIGQDGGTAFGSDVSYQSDPSRTADPDASADNISEFTQAGLFASETLGVACFAEGTLIATPGGEVAVETLGPGALVTTADGRAVPVLWLGRQTINSRSHRERAQLVRIRANVLGNHSDLIVTADHGMMVDDLVINASALVNGTTIDWVALADPPAPITVYHVETQAHDIILANGAPSETFLDAAERAMFDNHSEYLDLYGTERIIPEMDRPRIAARRLLPEAIRVRLGIAGHEIGWDNLSRSA